MVLKFFESLANSSLYWIASICALVAIFSSDNRIKSSFAVFNADKSYELVYFNG